jgi:hypothetical protein
MKIFLFLVTSFAFVYTNQTNENIPEINKKIVAFCDKNMGKKVGKGECWDLAADALNEVAAQWTSPYEFGKIIDNKKDIVFPGDIIQFEGVKLVYPDKSWKSFPKHTAIIYKVINKGEYTIAEQNSNGKRFVVLSDINLNYLEKGKYQIYRPQ